MVLKVGLTGGIGSGKSVVAGMFAKLGTEIIDADIIAKEITQPGQRAYQLIIKHFGIDILTKDKQLNRKQLRQLVFNDTKQKIWLEKTLHPLILQQIVERIQKVNSPYCIIIIPLLAEAWPEIDFIDRVCVVEAPENLRKQWAANRDQAALLEIEAIVANQSSSAQRLALADDIIHNDQDIPALQIQVHKLHQQYLQMTTI